MTLTAIVLLVFAASLHAGWNLVAKREHPSTIFFLFATVVGVICLSPLLVWQWHLFSRIPLEVWGVLVATGFCLALYYWGLAGAYRAGHMSVAYPLARSSPMIVVTVIAVLLGKSDQISAHCIVGIAFIVIGCFFLPLQRFSDFRLKNYFNACCLLALVAAFATAGYSMLDDHGLRVLRESSQTRLRVLDATLLYAPLEFASGAFWLSLFVLVTKTERQKLPNLWRQSWKAAVVMGIGICSAYLLVLASMAFVFNVSYVVAFRQLSVPLGALLGIALLKEPRDNT